MKYRFLFLFIHLYSMQVYAQQIGEFDHFFYKPMLYNPALTGADNVSNVMLLSRHQWTSFDNSPEVYNAVFETNLKKKKVGLGAHLSSDKKGLTNKTGGTLFYSYRSFLDRDTYLSFGIAIGVFNHSFDYGNIISESSFDPLLSSEKENKLSLDGNVGASFVMKNWQAGISIPQFLNKKVKFSNSSFQEKPHFIIHTKYKLYSNASKDLSFTPLVLLRLAPHAPTLLETSIIANWKNNIWASLNYKSSKALASTVGFSINKRYNIGYTYGISLGELSNYTGATHEVMLNLLFGKGVAFPGSNGSKIKLGLNGIIIEKSLIDARSIIANNSALKSDILAIREKLEPFINTNFKDPSLHILILNSIKELDDKLEARERNVIIKGELGLTGKKSILKANYNNVFIMLIDAKTNEEVGSYIPKPRSGKFIIIAQQGRSYKLEIEKANYKTYRKRLTFKAKKAGGSYEKRLIVRLKPLKKT